MRGVIALLALLTLLQAMKFTVTLEDDDLMFKEYWAYTIYLTIDDEKFITVSTSVTFPDPGAIYITYTFPDANCEIAGYLVFTETNYFYGFVGGDVIKFYYTVTQGINTFRYYTYVVLGGIGYGIENFAEECLKITTETHIYTSYITHTTRYAYTNNNLPTFAPILLAAFLSILRRKIRREC